MSGEKQENLTAMHPPIEWGDIKREEGKLTVSDESGFIVICAAIK